MSGDFRIVALVLCTAFMVICDSRAIGQRRSTDKDMYIRGTYINEKHRGKRSMPTLIAKLIRTANLLFKDKNTKIYEKTGGFAQALDDFDRLHATNVKRAGEAQWAAVMLLHTYTPDITTCNTEELQQKYRLRTTSRSGDVGDTKVTLQESFGRYTMSFWKLVQRKDGTTDLLVEKIHYPKKF